jgi:hypothetical protein
MSILKLQFVGKVSIIHTSCRSGVGRRMRRDDAGRTVTEHPVKLYYYKRLYYSTGVPGTE